MLAVAVEEVADEAEVLRRRVTLAEERGGGYGEPGVTEPTEPVVELAIPARCFGEAGRGGGDRRASRRVGEHSQHAQRIGRPRPMVMGQADRGHRGALAALGRLHQLDELVDRVRSADPVEGPLGCVGRAFASHVRGGDGEAGPTLRCARDVEPQAVSVGARADVVTGDEAEVVGGSSVSVHAPVVPARTEPPDRELALQPGRSCLRFDEADQERATVQRKQAVPRVDALSVDADDGPERRTGRGAVPRDRRRADPPRSSSISVKQRPHRRLCVERVRAPPVDLPVGSDERCSCALAEDAMRSERRAV